MTPYTCATCGTAYVPILAEQWAHKCPTCDGPLTRTNELTRERRRNRDLRRDLQRLRATTNGTRQWVEARARRALKEGPAACVALCELLATSGEVARITEVA